MTKSIKFLQAKEILEIHKNIIETYGGALGIRSNHLFLSAIAQPEFKIQNKYVHKNIYLMTAAYLFHLIKNHPFVDGNKRTSVASALLFLTINKTKINITEKQLTELSLKTATTKITKEKIAAILKK
ncbi:TPA: type II toxin-antitoxin system death-on-curing family toxin [Candidatus Dependentiae bacterium]|nr:MAG: hypothetical protein UR14_C0006G0030 [candidate division TM6 bacterium GW2011_GWE2_31_21]KKP53547.1 MAG: hypothetical protein UR43_C0004G0088 [candidate division TM6 bacterium GW2011_GWF2_33_332]HBS48212.1 type II toxin-antitoxin system death-on-curing family toxin [Candidatus Dependentiae bacterium]HBZ73638.1 type II toxin-antitoxin system death-on-curing family toxin [Candidatus Dependentiae bacterium]